MWKPVQEWWALSTVEPSRGMVYSGVDGVQWSDNFYLLLMWRLVCDNWVLSKVLEWIFLKKWLSGMKLNKSIVGCNQANQKNILFRLFLLFYAELGTRQFLLSQQGQRGNVVKLLWHTKMFCPLGVKKTFVFILSTVVLWYYQIDATGVACAQLWYFVRTVWFARSHTYILCKNKRWNVLHYLYDFYGQIIFSSSFCSQCQGGAALRPRFFFMYNIGRIPRFESEKLQLQSGECYQWSTHIP